MSKFEITIFTLKILVRESIFKGKAKKFYWFFRICSFPWEGNKAG